MMQNKILILDDKSLGEDFSTLQVLTKLNVSEKDLIEYFGDSESLWSESSNGEDVILLKNYSKYPFIFIHDSFESPLVRDGLKAILLEKLSKTSEVILFSGSRSESEIPIKKIYDAQISQQSFYYEILRRQYFNNLKNFIDSYLVSGKFQIKYLYNQYANPKKDRAYALLANIRTNLEESVQFAIESTSFNELLNLYGYRSIPEISKRFSHMTDDEFIESIENIIEQN